MPSENGLPPYLSDAQRDLIESAVRNGYFKMPREISTVELAEKNDMSSREASKEMNRALDVVLRDADIGD